MNSPSSGQIFIIIWFSIAVFIEIVSSIALRLWLRRKGVKLIYGLVGIPGYMEYAYKKWCQNQGQSPSNKLLMYRSLSVINVIVAAVFFITFISH